MIVLIDRMVAWNHTHLIYFGADSSPPPFLGVISLKRQELLHPPDEEDLWPSLPLTLSQHFIRAAEESVTR